MASARMITDHEEIRRWAEERKAVPSCVLGTGDDRDTGMIRLDFPGFSGEGKLQPIDWEQWFRSFDENNLGLLVQDQTASGETSNFNKLVSRDSEAGGKSGHSKSSGKSASSSRSKSSGSKASGSRSKSSK